MTTPTAEELLEVRYHGESWERLARRLAQRLATALAEAKSWEEQTEMMRELVLQQSTRAEAAEACCEATHNLIVTKGDVLASENIALRAQLARLVEAATGLHQCCDPMRRLRAVLDEIDAKGKP